MSELTPEERALLDGRAAAITAEILAECDRQYGEEGYNPKHDEAHAPAEFAMAGAAYAYTGAAERYVAGEPLNWFVREFALRQLWPWWADHFKPKDRRRDLVRGAALLVRAIQRLDREAIAAADQDAA